jgi:hypothetical protein
MKKKQQVFIRIQTEGFPYCIAEKKGNFSDGKAARLGGHRNQVHGIRTEVAEGDGGDSHSELCFRFTEKTYADQCGVAHDALTGESRIRREFHLNLAFGSNFGHFSVKVAGIARD